VKIQLEIDISLTPRTKAAIRWVATPLALLLGTAAVAHATIDTTWINPGSPLSASQLKANFQDAETRLAALEASKSTEWAPLSYVPVVQTTGSGTPTVTQFAVSGVSRMVGDTLEIRLLTTASATPSTGGVDYRWTLPSGTSPPPNKLFPGNAVYAGTGVCNVAGVNYDGAVFADNSGKLWLSMANKACAFNDHCLGTLKTGDTCYLHGGELSDWS
jgi:hypothetical protein